MSTVSKTTQAQYQLQHQLSCAGPSDLPRRSREDRGAQSRASSLSRHRHPLWVHHTTFSIGNAVVLMHLDLDIICSLRHLASIVKTAKTAVKTVFRKDDSAKILDVESAWVGHDNAV
jgi:hypothetical protein